MEPLEEAIQESACISLRIVVVVLTVFCAFVPGAPTSLDLGHKDSGIPMSRPLPVDSAPYKVRSGSASG